MLAKFLVKRREKLAKRFAVPGHEFHKEKSRDSGVAFGEIKAEADAAAFLAADENVLFEHEFADVFKADGNFVKFAIEFGGELVDEFCDGKGFCDVAGKF